MKTKNKPRLISPAVARVARAEAVGAVLTGNPIVAIATAVAATLLDMLDRPKGRKARGGSREARANLRRTSGEAPGTGSSANREGGVNHG